MIPHSIQYMIVRFGNGVFAIASLAIYTRMLSPAEYGVYSLCMAIATVASALLFQWLNVAVGRFYPMHLDDPGKVMAVVVRGFWVATVSATLFFIGTLAVHEVITVEPAMSGILFLLTVLIGRYTIALQVANAQGEPARYGLLSWSKGGGTLLAGFIFIYFGMGAQGALLGFLVGLVFAVIAFAPKPSVWINLGNGDDGLSLKMFHYGMPLTLNLLAIIVVDFVDRFLIGSLLGVAYVAPYAVSYDLVQQSVGPMMSVMYLAAFPLIVKAFESASDEQVRTRIQALGIRIVAVGLPVTVGIGVLASDISETIFGSDYSRESATIMPWLAAAMFVAAFKNYFLDLVFQLRHATKYQCYISFLMAAVNIFLNLFLLQRYGVAAAAWATLAAFSVGALASWIVGRSIFSLPPLGYVFMGSVVVSSAAMATVLHVLPPSTGIISLLVKVVLGIIIYALMAWTLDVAGCRRLLKA